MESPTIWRFVAARSIQPRLDEDILTTAGNADRAPQTLLLCQLVDLGQYALGNGLVLAHIVLDVDEEDGQPC